MLSPKIIDPDVLLSWYREGIFPMGDEETGEISLYDPDPRTIIDPERFHVPHGLKKSLRDGKFEIRCDTSFNEVIACCAGRETTWITDVIAESYKLLFRLGHAHSVEAWLDGTLAGGLYGVSIGGAFFGESMFHLQTDASKVALAALVERMRQRGMILLDTQFMTSHLAQFHAEEIPRTEYRRRLSAALQLPCVFHP